MSHISFISNDNQQITWSDFYQQVSLFRSAIRQSKVSKVLLFDEDSYQFSVAFLALLLEQCDVILPPNNQSKTLEIIAHSADAYAGNISITGIDKIVIEQQSDLLDSATPSTASAFKQFNSQVVFFTSGSTGQPKAITKHSQQLINEIETLFQTFDTGYQQASAVLSTVSHQHIYGLLFKILLPLRFAKKIVVTNFEYPEHIVSHLTEHTDEKVILLSSPAHLKRLINDNVLLAVRDKLSVVFSSGGALAFEVASRFYQQMNIAVTEVFGSTETGGIAWRYSDKATPQAWRLFNGLTYQAVVTDNRSIAQLQISSPFMSEQNYLTDDLVQVIDQNHFMLHGRIDRTIKLEEKRVNLSHMEQCLLSYSGVSAAKVFLLNSTLKQSLVAVVEIEDAAKDILKKQSKRILNELLKAHLLTEFERVCLPKKWRYVDELPVNAQGKVTQQQLEVLFD